MTRHRPAGPETDSGASAPANDDHARSSRSTRQDAGQAAEQQPDPPRTREEAEAWYVTARDAWIEAMHAANSGKPADLASLAIAQEAYEAAVEERELWLSGARVAIPIDMDQRERRTLEAAIQNEIAWRGVHEPHKRRGFFSRFRRRKDE